MPSARPVFSLRFNDEMTLPALRVIAKSRSVSVNALIETMIEREIPLEVARIEGDFRSTLEALRSYRGKFEDDWAAFAKSEGIEDPVQASRVDAADDPLGVRTLFAAGLE